MTDLDKLTEMGRPTEKTREWEAARTEYMEATLWKARIIERADDALAERRASDIEGWERVKELEWMLDESLRDREIEADYRTDAEIKADLTAQYARLTKEATP